MKNGVLFLIVFLISSTLQHSFAVTNDDWVISIQQENVLSQAFTITPGQFHKGGDLSYEITKQDIASDSLDLTISYHVLKKALVPVPSEYLSGNTVQTLPLNYLYESGYLELEKKHEEEFSDSYVTHLGRVNIDGLTDVHHVKITAKNGKSEMEVFYHPSLPALGWSRVILVLHTPIPFLKNYTMMAIKK